MFGCLSLGAVMAPNLVNLSVQFEVKTESVSVEFGSVTLAVFERIALEYTYRISSLCATQFTVEKSNSVECFAMIFKNCFCRTTPNFAPNFTPGKQFWRPSLGN